jgi:hypothetical protein
MRDIHVNCAKACVQTPTLQLQQEHVKRASNVLRTLWRTLWCAVRVSHVCSSLCSFHTQASAKKHLLAHSPRTWRRRRRWRAVRNLLLLLWSRCSQPLVLVQNTATRARRFTPAAAVLGTDAAAAVRSRPHLCCCMRRAACQRRLVALGLLAVDRCKISKGLCCRTHVERSDEQGRGC